MCIRDRANPVTAIDIDDWCVNNSKDNIALNHIHNITVELGDANLLLSLIHICSLMAGFSYSQHNISFDYEKLPGEVRAQLHDALLFKKVKYSD